MKKQTIQMWVMTALVAVMSVVAFAAMETKYDGAISGAADTSAAVLFGPGSGKTVVKGLLATTDKAWGQVKFYARTGNKIVVGAAESAAVTNIQCVNPSGTTLAEGDTVAIQHATGTTEFRTLGAGPSATNIYLTAGTTYALTTSDYIYEMSVQGVQLVGTLGTEWRTNEVLNLTGDLFATPTDSPLYCVLDGQSNTVLTVTVDR